MDNTILNVNNLVTCFDGDEGRITVLDNISFSLKRGETLGLVGESGSGKSVAALSILRLLPKPAGKIIAGSIELDGQDILKLPIEQMHKIRGFKVAMIFQEPMTALNPVQRIGRQLAEVYEIHFKDKTVEDIRIESIRLLEKVGIADAEKRLSEYPHQLSGGLRQRVMIAMALACDPDVLIADEPTTALDVTTQNQILNLMRELQAEHNMAIIFVTHDLAVVAEMCDRVLVMYAGRLAEEANVEDLFEKPKHPYTKGLLQSIPRLDSPSKVPLQVIEGVVPSLNDLPVGCRFQSRCIHKTVECEEILPEMESVSSDHKVACIHWEKLAQ